MSRMNHRNTPTAVVTALAIAVAAGTAPALEPLLEKNACLRGAFRNVRIRFEKEKKGHVAFIGGSITHAR